MFAKLAFIASIAILAVATPTPNAQSTCSTGAVQCCSSSGSSSDPAIATILAGYADVDYFSVVKAADSWFTQPRYSYRICDRRGRPHLHPSHCKQARCL